MGAEGHAFSETMEHVALSRGFSAPFADLRDCESLFTHLENRKMVTVKYLVRRFLRNQQFIEEGGLDNVYWLPGTENPADGLAKIKSEMGPILALQDAPS